MKSRQNLLFKKFVRVDSTSLFGEKLYADSSCVIDSETSKLSSYFRRYGFRITLSATISVIPKS